MLDGQVSWPRTINALIDERDDITAGGYRRVVRTLKGMREELWKIQGDEVQSFLIESLVYAAGPAAVRRGKLRTRCVNALRAVTPVLTDEAAGRTRRTPRDAHFSSPSRWEATRRRSTVRKTSWRPLSTSCGSCQATARRRYKPERWPTGSTDVLRLSCARNVASGSLPATWWPARRRSANHSR